MLKKRFIQEIFLEMIKGGLTMKICFISSSGGHFEQLMKLGGIIKKYDSFIVTEYTKYGVSANVSYTLCQVNRQEKNWILKFLKNILKSWKIFVKERPDVIITTGTMSVIPMCLIGKLFRKKIVFIESFAKITSPTLTGKLIYHFADLFIVQWKELIKFYPNALFLGGIY